MTSPEHKVILLEQNYRSTQTILDAAQNVVRRNRQRKDKKLWTALGTGEKVYFYKAFDEEGEGQFIAHEILRLQARGDIETARRCRGHVSYQRTVTRTRRTILAFQHSL